MSLKSILKRIFRPFLGLNRHVRRLRARLNQTKSYRVWRGIGCWWYRARRWQNYLKRLRGELNPI